MRRSLPFKVVTPLGASSPVAPPLGGSAVNSGSESAIQESREYAGWGRSKAELLRRLAVLSHRPAVLDPSTDDYDDLCWEESTNRWNIIRHRPGQPKEVTWFASAKAALTWLHDRHTSSSRH